MAAPELKIQPDGNVDFDVLYMNMGSYIAAQLEAKGPDGERLYADACEWMESAFSTQAARDDLVTALDS